MLSRFLAFIFFLLFANLGLCTYSIQNQEFVPQNYNYQQTNLTNIVKNAASMYTNPSGSSDGSPSSGGMANAHYKFITISPQFVSTHSFPYFKINPQCFQFSWSINEVGSSTAFIPQISVTNQFVAFCIGYKATLTLNGYGQCGFIALFRICGRNTAPCYYGNDNCCSGKSCSTDSSTCPNCKAQVATRICAFNDPLDLTDTKPGCMPFQQLTYIPSSFPSGDGLLALGAMLTLTGCLIPGIGSGVMMVGIGFMLAGGMMDLIQFISSKINLLVVENLGCVEIPLTPGPPPYCPQVLGYTPQASLMAICQQSPDFTNNTYASQYQNYTYSTYVNANPAYPTDTQISTQNMTCENASYHNQTLYSIFENPVVRISFDNMLPLCSSTYKGTSDVCVKAKSLTDPFVLWYNDNNLLSACSTSGSTNCLNFPSGGTYSGVGFRPLYNVSNPSAYGLTGTLNSIPFSILSTLPSFLYSLSSSLVFAGINFSNYVDASPGNLVTLTDVTNLSRTFVVYLNSDGNQVCVAERKGNSTQAVYISTGTDPDIFLSCVSRPSMSTPPQISNCNTSGSTNNCHYNGSFSSKTCFSGATCPYSGNVNLVTSPRIKLTVGQTLSTKNYTTSGQIGIIEVDTATPYGTSGTGLPLYKQPYTKCIQDDLSSSSGISSSGRNCSLYGYNAFSAYVTDYNNQALDTIYNSTITPNYTTTNFYSAGTQFNSGNYCRGASLICIKGYEDSTKKVVAKMVAHTSGFTSGQYSASQILSDRVIPAYVPGKNQTITSGFFNPQTQYVNSSQSVTRTAIGVYDTATKQYIENSTCTVDPDNYCVANGTPTTSSAVTAICSCKTLSGSKTCTISGCNYAFLVNSTSFPIDIGYKTTSGQYTTNSVCTSSSDFSCTVPCAATGTCSSPFPVTSIQCLCSKNCTTHCTGAQTPSGYCTISGCAYAFQPSVVSETVAQNYFISTSGKTYPVSGTSGCPNFYQTSSGKPCYSLRNANSIELGLCSPIAQPTCAAITHTSPSDATAEQDGYASWPATTLGSSNLNVVGTCITGTTKAGGVSPTRSCTYIDSGYQKIINTSGALVDGCPTYTVSWGAISNPCLPYPGWWPSQFLANQDFRGAIYNHFNVNYDYVKKLIPTYNNYSQYGNSQEDWVTSSPNNCQRNYSYNINKVSRKDMDGDQEMLFMTADNWNKFLADQSANIKWIYATEDNIGSDEQYSSYNGCYVYDVTNYLSLNKIPSFKVGLKICKYNDNISFSLVDFTKNSSTDYTNDAYIMQSNILDYLDSQSVNNYNITNNTSGAGRYINHGFVVYRPGFDTTKYDTAKPPTDFVPIQTAESVNLEYLFYDVVNSDNSGNSHDSCNFTKYDTSNGCALVMHRTPLTYPYAHSTVAYNCGSSCESLTFAVSSGYYIPTAVNYSSQSSKHKNDNFSNYYYFQETQQASSFNSGNCTTNIKVKSFTPGNSAMNPSMFYWASPTNYSPCNQTTTVVNALTSRVFSNDCGSGCCLNNN